MEQPFYIGQKVVCIESHPWGMVVRGFEGFVTKVGKNRCGDPFVCVGILNPFKKIRCVCGKSHRTGNDMQFAINRFAPIQEGFQAISFEKVLEQELSSVN